MSRRSNPTTEVSTRILERIERDPVARAAYDAQAALVALGRKLRAARLALGATQAEVARRAGMTQAELSRLENGLLANGVTYTTLSQLSQVLRHEVVLQPAKGAARASAVRARAREPRAAARARASRARPLT